MKLALQQLEQRLTKQCEPIYLVSSDELLLVQETADIIRSHAQKRGFSERTLITVDTHNEWAKTLYSDTHTLSLFASKKIIELNMHHTKFNASTTKALQDYAEKPPQDVILIVRASKIDGKTEKSAWFQKLEKKCVFIPIWPMSRIQLPAWIMQRAKKHQLILSKEAADYMADYVEGNLLAASQEIEKLSLLQTENPIDKKTLVRMATNNAHYDVFDLVESMIAKNHIRSLRILENLRAEDTEPTLILWALTRELRILADMFVQLKQGISISMLFNKFRIFEKRQSSIRSFLQHQSLDTCWKLLSYAAHIDRIIKGAEVGQLWNALESLVLQQLH